jgi:hypothetical protein
MQLGDGFRYDVRDLIASDNTRTNGNSLSALTTLSAQIETLADPSYSLISEPYAAGGALIIRPDLTTHRQIERLLDAKRETSEYP